MDGEHPLSVAAADRGPAAVPSPLPRLLLLLGLTTLAFYTGSFFFKAPALRHGITVGDLLETAGAFAVLLLYQAIARATETAPIGFGAGFGRGVGAAWPGVLLSLATITYALGSGIHLAANSIHDMLDVTALGDPWRLADFWDERAGHVLVDGARIGFAIALTGFAARAAGAGRSALGTAGLPPPGNAGAAAARNAAVAVGAAAYGFLYFAVAVEGQTVPLALSFCVLYAGWSAAWKSPARGGPVPTFFRIAAWISLLFLAIWGVGHGGFPEFSRVGFRF